MKINLTHKEANLVMALVYEMAAERGVVHSDYGIWRLTEGVGTDLAQSVMDKLEDANDKHVRKTGKGRDLSGAPKGSIQEATWSK